MKLTRRSFVGMTTAVALAADTTDWRARASEILARIKPPQFPDRDFDITKYGAKPDAEAGSAIKQAIEACATAGGGRVVIPRGTFFTGPIHLKSNVNLYLAEGATPKFSTNP